MSDRKKMLMADFLCLLTAAIWGTGFIASQTAIDAHMSPALIMVIRFTVGSLIMALFSMKRLKKVNMQVIKAGLLPGLFLFGAFYAQILGQERTTVSHCAFLTATNVVMVPFLEWAASRHRPPVRTFMITLLTLIGIGILSIAPGSFSLTFNLGDGLSLLCALLFALHITSVGRAVQKEDVVLVNLIQMAVAAIISAVLFLVTDLHALDHANLSAGLPAVLYLGLFSTCLCYFLQALAQKYTSASQAGVLLSTEGMFASLLSVLLGMEDLTLNMICGGLLILLSVILLEYFSAKNARTVQ